MPKKEATASQSLVEELKTALRDAAAALAEASFDLDKAGLQTAASRAHRAHHKAMATLDVSEEEH